MKCQKCVQPAVVHLTELFTDGAVKKAVELHLCYEHALESGLLAPPTQETPTLPALSPPPMHTQVHKKKVEAGGESGGGLTIVPKVPPAGVALVRKESGEGAECPICGSSWGSFKTSGKMGCPHDYVHFEGKLVGLVKRAHEGASQHAGKVPAKMRHSAGTRDVTASRLRRELQLAVDAEKYEEAARLRDLLKKVASEG